MYRSQSKQQKKLIDVLLTNKVISKLRRMETAQDLIFENELF